MLLDINSCVYVCVDQLAFAFPPTWDTGQNWPRCEMSTEACGGREEMKGGIPSDLTICQFICTAEGVIPLYSISRLAECEYMWGTANYIGVMFFFF